MRRAKGWFTRDWRRGDRTPQEQMLGLGPLFDDLRAAPAVVWDLGCAEGDVAAECAAAGASHVIACDVVPAAIDEARQQWGEMATFVVADLNAPTWRDAMGVSSPNIVLMLAVLHKLRDPSRLVRDVCTQRPRLIVVRLPPATAPVIIDHRSGNVPCDVEAIMAEAGYELERVTNGSRKEWCGYFRA